MGVWSYPLFGQNVKNLKIDTLAILARFGHNSKWHYRQSIQCNQLKMSEIWKKELLFTMGMFWKLDRYPVLSSNHGNPVCFYKFSQKLSFKPKMLDFEYFILKLARLLPSKMMHQHAKFHEDQSHSFWKNQEIRGSNLEVENIIVKLILV